MLLTVHYALKIYLLEQKGLKGWVEESNGRERNHIAKYCRAQWKTIALVRAGQVVKWKLLT